MDWFLNYRPELAQHIALRGACAHDTRAPARRHPDARAAHQRAQVRPRRARIPLALGHPLALAEVRSRAVRPPRRGLPTTACATSRRNRKPRSSAATPTGAAPSGFRSTTSSSRRSSGTTISTATRSSSSTRPAPANCSTSRKSPAKSPCASARIFTLNDKGERPCFGDNFRYANDPHWRDYLLFHEYFHAEIGCGLGANHQTGWTALITRCLGIVGRIAPEE